jgi:O-antigen/teichoic acid export membrane protein
MPIISILIPMRLVAAGATPADALAAFGVLVGMTLPLLAIPQTLISSLSTALVPELSSAHNDQKRDAVRNQIINALKFTLFTNFALVPIYMAVGEGIGIFVFADQTSGIFLSNFAWAMIPMSLSQITTAILNSLGAETRAMKHYFIGAVALFASIWFLPQFIGIGALVAGIGACMIIASIMNLVLIAKISGAAVVKSTIRQLGAFVLMCAPAALLGYFLFDIVVGAFGLFWTLALCGATSGGVFLVLCDLFNVVKFRAFTVALKK